MLIKRVILKAIKNGRVDLAFRRWERLSVKPGSTFKTAVGLVRIGGISEIKLGDITDLDAVRAGYEDKARAASDLSERDGRIYRIELSYAGADPRLALREDDRLDDKDIEALSKKLKRLDDRSKEGPWSRKVMAEILKQPRTRAATLAESLGYEKEWLKLNVRKLKNLGLTISHEPGYEISPRGKAFLKNKSV